MTRLIGVGGFPKVLQANYRARMQIKKKKDGEGSGRIPGPF